MPNHIRDIKVNIIIPTFNQSRYLLKAVESALSQNYANLEVIVSDDGSTDDTESVINPFKADKRFRYFKNTTNLGRVGNYHKALYHYATGDYVLNLDGDDYLVDPNYIKEAIDLIKKHDLIMVFANKKAYFEKDGSFVKDSINRNLPQIMKGNDLFLNSYKNIAIPHMTTLYNRQYALKIGYYTKNIISADWESVLRLILNHKVGFIDRHVGVWRKHEANESHLLDLEKILSNVEYIESPYDFALNKNISSKAKLDYWRSKMLKKYFVKNILKGMAAQNSAFVSSLLQSIKKYDLTLYRRIAFDLRMIGLKLLTKNKRVFIFTIKHILKKESFLKDFY